MRVLAVDYGKVRVGLAVSDPLGHTAQPLDVIPRPKRGSLVAAVAEVVQREGVQRIVVGLPLKLDGSEGVEAEACRTFARALEGRCGIPVEMFDERMSTVEATRAMRAGGVDGRGQRGRVDKVAAAVVLRAWLDARRDRPADSAGDADPAEPVAPRQHARDELTAEPKRHRSRGGRGTRPRGTQRPSRREWLD